MRESNELKWKYVGNKRDAVVSLISLIRKRYKEILENNSN